VDHRPAAVIDAVQSALQEALKIPEWDRTLRLIEHPASHFAVPPGHGEKFTLVEVTLFSGRSMGAKRTLYQTIVRNLAALGVPPLDIKISLLETPPENWGIRGGMPASEIDLGFEIDV
jgi:phenylpyruvate tautomerase PptA (4-oxalocrotonate tautomerase family)